MQFFSRTRLSPSSSIAWFVLLTLFLCAKVLWGYWTRDLTFGDTSAYFEYAIGWAYLHEVNIVWSPFYTVYYGFWWNLLPDAVSATFVHRLMIILVSTALVAWLALLTLPRMLALILVAWWVALPIHYDTLYEVHLFGALPLILMGVVAFAAPTRWHYPLWLGLALVTVLLVRNEYVIMFAVFAAFLGAIMITDRNRSIFAINGWMLLRYGSVLTIVSALVVGFYTMSPVKGSTLAEVSQPKHTQNMCQVYAFGYQQRHPEWTLSPWTECQGLMEQTFGEPLPTLGRMMTTNPRAVAEHFWWNLSLAPAGFELLLFNVISGKDNPDYVPAASMPVVPRLLLGMFVMVGLFGLYRVMVGQKPGHLMTRRLIVTAAPILLGAALMVVAVILTQRPRPSYLLGFGVLLVWLWLVLVAALLPALTRFDQTRLPLIILIVLVIAVPSYASLPLQSKSGYLGLLYSEAKLHADSLCSGVRVLAAGEYLSELSSYLCAPYDAENKKYRESMDGIATDVFSLVDLAGEPSSNPLSFVEELQHRSVSAVIIDPWLFQTYPGLQSCGALREAFLSSGWELLSYRNMDGGRCVATYHRAPNQSDQEW